MKFIDLIIEIKEKDENRGKIILAKYFQNIDKNILFNIMKRKIKYRKLLWLTKEILYSNGKEKGLPIR